MLVFNKMFDLYTLNRMLCVLFPKFKGTDCLLVVGGVFEDVDSDRSCTVRNILNNHVLTTTFKAATLQDIVASRKQCGGLVINKESSKDELVAHIGDWLQVEVGLKIDVYSDLWEIKQLDDYRFTLAATEKNVLVRGMVELEFEGLENE